jgi:NAD(P)-dependent dehydrogenase (short-subunit alcohol dehydrogenase family)
MLQGKVCVVTGAGQGMGRATAVEMAIQGAKVVASDIKIPEVEETVKRIRDAGGEGIAVACNLREKDDIKNLIDTAAITYGGIDVVHTNAGIHETDLTPETRVDLLRDEVWDAVYEVNLRAVWLTVKYAVPYLRKSSAPAVVNAGSVGSFVAYPMAACYTATKGAVAQLTKAMAVDLAGDGIRVNCYCPGTIDTPMVAKYIEAAEDKEEIESVLTASHLIPRLGRPEEVAKLVCFLASEDASFINGAVYLIDGGALAWRGMRS